MSCTFDCEGLFPKTLSTNTIFWYQELLNGIDEPRGCQNTEGGVSVNVES